MFKQNPISRLRRKFLIIIMSLLTLVMMLIVALLNIVMSSTQQAQNLELLQSIIANNGALPITDLPRNGHRGWYVVFLDKDYTVNNIINTANFSYDDEAMIEYIEYAINHVDRTRIDDMLYYVNETEDRYIVAFLDISVDNAILSQLFNMTIFIGLGSLVGMFIIALALSHWLIAPVKNSFDAQRRFIADASHELKTPIATISTNTDVLIDRYGDLKWLSFIKAETARMQRLVGDLLYLASSEHGKVEHKRERFNLSDTVALTAMSFEGRAFEGDVRIELDIASELFMVGDNDGIKQVIAILVDNAVKHTEVGGTITVSLKKLQNRNNIVVKNTGDGIPLNEREKIFERFYRSDTVRNSDSASYGLGLAIAKAIVLQHKGRITAGGVEGEYAELRVVL